MSEQIPNQKALDAVVMRASRDREFRARLLADPHGAIAEVLGPVVPPDLRIAVIERDPAIDVLVVLPPLETGGDAEIHPLELGEVVGGDGGNDDDLTWDPLKG